MRKLATPLLLVAFACSTTSQQPAARVGSLPITEPRPVTETLHGVTITDPYRWLEDQQSAETRTWISRQNAYTDSMLSGLPNKPRFAKRIESLLNTNLINTLQLRGGRYFLTKREAGQDLFSIYMRESESGPDILLIDPAPLSPDKTTSVGIVNVTNDGRVLTYSVRKGGEDEVEEHFFDVDARREIGMVLGRARYAGVTVTPDHASVYFTRYAAGVAPRLYRRAIAGGPEDLLFGEQYGPEKLISSSISEDGRYLTIHVFHGSAGQKSEIYVKDLSSDGPIRTVVNDLDARSTADDAGETLIIETNWNAPNGRIMRVNIADPGRDHWTELIAENKDAPIEGSSLAGGRLFVRYLQNVKPRVLEFTIDGQPRGEIKFDTLGTLTDIAGQWTSPVAFYRFSSYTVPVTIYRYDVPTGTSSVFFRVNAPVNPDHFTVEQVWYQSKDGTQVPMFLTYMKGLQRNGRNPVLLTGYGGFNSSSLPNFSTSAVTWAENGGIYAVANLRGGGEFGETWHRAGMLDNKQNVFDDFIAAAEFLIQERYTSPRHLGITGGSNGGLLVTAFSTQRPELARAAVVSYPLIDMVRYHKFLVARFWVPEYGSADDPEHFKFIHAYSPYHRVRAGTKYPATLFITGDADTRVAPLHARKMAALMQASTGSTQPIMLRYHVSSGHSGGEPLKVQVNNSAETLAFMDWQLR
jgi:prolyl oligopeptidase